MTPARACGSMVAVLAFVALGAAMQFSRAGESSGAQANVPASKGEDAFPAGCVDCHAKLPDRDVRLGTMLAELDHPATERKVVTVPDDCGKCHAEDGTAERLAPLVHLTHFENATENHFVLEFGGDCLHCHALDLDSGEMRVKKGPRNW